jgi:selenocysteine lyase/cysteine desulfurase
VTAEAIAAARARVARFAGARPDDGVIFTRNTTDAIALLAAALPERCGVVSFRFEHHANLLPWRRRRAHIELEVPRTIDALLTTASRALAALPPGDRLLAVTGASNVTGERLPLDELVTAARRHGARIFVDAAQLAPHGSLEIATRDLDWVAFSGHKLHAPYGAGALVGRLDWLDAAPPYLEGGGAVDRVDDVGATWRRGAARHEAGTPNVAGIVALGEACAALEHVGASAIEDHERALRARLVEGLAALPGVELLSMFGGSAPTVGVVSLRVRDRSSQLLAAALAAEHGISVRAGFFCAQPLVGALLGAEGASCDRHDGALRASFGACTSPLDVERMVSALSSLVHDGPRARYVLQDGQWRPIDDARPRPTIAG